MELIKTIKQIFRINGKELIPYIYVTAVAGLMGIMMTFVLMYNKNRDGHEAMSGYVTMGGIFALVLGAIVLFCSAFSLQSHFNLAVSMGRTRKYFIPSQFLLVAAGGVVVEAMVILITQIETVLYPLCFGKGEFEINLKDYILNPVLAPGLILGFSVLNLLIGSLLMRFGVKFFWVVWAIWMFCWLILPRLLRTAEDNPQSWQARTGAWLTGLFASLGTGGTAVLAVIVLAAGLIAAMLLLRRQKVTA